MTQPLSTISTDDFAQLNAFGKSEGPAAAANLERKLRELHPRLETIALGSQCFYNENVAALTDRTITALSTDSLMEVLRFPPELQRPVEQVAACIELMRRHEENYDSEVSIAEAGKGPLPGAVESYFSFEDGDGQRDSDWEQFTYGALQRRLSRILVDHPVLMDSRIVIGVRPRGNDDFSTIPAALAELSFAALPCRDHGLSLRELKTFACKPSVKKGVSEAVPDSSISASIMRKQQPMLIAFGGGVAPQVRGATRGAFMASLLELSNYADERSGGPLVELHLAGNRQKYNLYPSLAKIFWDVATAGGHLSNLSPGQLASALRRPAPFGLRYTPLSIGDEPAWSVTSYGSDLHGKHLDTLSDFPEMSGDLGKQLKLELDQGLFKAVLPGMMLPELRCFISREEMAKRTHGVIALLSEVGLAASPRMAAALLSRIAVGSGRSACTTAGPDVDMETAMGFMDALRAHGAVPVVDNMDEVARSWLAGAPAHAILQRWQAALHVHMTMSSMEAVLSRELHEAAPATPDLSTQRKNRLV
ncbi:hypothetical protein ABIC83_002726 [Roseateles asaccharophilus]|uniref:hypothetical protein n=1 Tax=Roseateles asaccharophilus TaxID=582607 RepID=UPI0038340E0D